MARGWLRVEKRKSGKMWVLRFKTTRKTDGKRVEHKVPVGPVREFPSESSAWKEVERQHLNVNTPDFRGAVKFSDLAEHYIAARTRRPERCGRSEVPLHHRCVQTQPAKPSHPTLGYAGCVGYRAVGDRAVVEGRKERRAARESYGGQNAASDVARLQERHAVWSDSSRRGVEPTSLRSL